MPRKPLPPLPAEDWKTVLARSVTGGWCCDLSAGSSGAAHRDDCEAEIEYVAPSTTENMTDPPLPGSSTWTTH